MKDLLIGLVFVLLAISTIILFPLINPLAIIAMYVIIEDVILIEYLDYKEKRD